MIIVTAFAIGSASFLLRSVPAVAVVTCLIALTFAAACLAAGGLLPLRLLLLAYLGFNAGLVACFCGAVALEAWRTRSP